MAVYNSVVNAAAMVKSGVGVALCLDLGANLQEDVCFVPLRPTLESGSVLFWKKNQALDTATAQFIRFLRNAL